MLAAERGYLKGDITRGLRLRNIGRDYLESFVFIGKKTEWFAKHRQSMAEGEEAAMTGDIGQSVEWNMEVRELKL